MTPFEKLNAYLAQVGGCTNGDCKVVKPKGMHTNGGCRCLDNRITATRVVYAYQQYVQEIEAERNSQTGTGHVA